MWTYTEDCTCNQSTLNIGAFLKATLAALLKCTRTLFLDCNLNQKPSSSHLSPITRDWATSRNGQEWTRYLPYSRPVNKIRWSLHLVVAAFHAPAGMEEQTSIHIWLLSSYYSSRPCQIAPRLTSLAFGCRNFCGSPLFQQYSLYTSLGHKLASIKIPNRPMQWPQRGNKYPSMISLLVDLSAHQSRSLTVILNCGSHAQRHLPLLLTRENGEYKVKWDWQNWLPNGLSWMPFSHGWRRRALSRGL